MIDRKELIALGVPQAQAIEWEGPLCSTMSAHKVITVQRIASFVAQLIHESNGFRTLSENFNYTPAALMSTFNTAKAQRFPKILAEQFGRTADHPANREMIAMIAYADRMGNGSVDSGDGWKYRGRGPIQLTGKDNYLACGTYIGVDLITNPDRLLEPVIGAMAAGWYWTIGNPTGKSLNAFADIGEIDRISKAINGGSHGLEARRALYQKALKVLA